MDDGIAQMTMQGERQSMVMRTTIRIIYVLLLLPFVGSNIGRKWRRQYIAWRAILTAQTESVGSVLKRKEDRADGDERIVERITLSGGRGGRRTRLVGDRQRAIRAIRHRPRSTVA